MQITTMTTASAVLAELDALCRLSPTRTSVQRYPSPVRAILVAENNWNALSPSRHWHLRSVVGSSTE